MRIREGTIKELGRVLGNDPDLTAEGVVAFIQGGARAAEACGGVKNCCRVLSRSQVAGIFGVTCRRVDQYAQMGLIRRIHLAGMRRAVGYDEASVMAACSGRCLPLPVVTPSSR